MAVLCSIVLTHTAWTVAIQDTKLPQRRSIRRQLIGGDRLGVDTLVLQQPPEQLHRRMSIAPLLDKDVQHLAFVIHGPPEPHAPSADLADHLVQMPPARRGVSPAPDVSGDQRSELDYPATDCFAADIDPALGEQFLHIADAEGEAEI